jgi:uncharacterized protein YndB with AHSA1/START domain
MKMNAPKETTSLRVTRQRLIRAPLDHVWSVVGDFGREDRWARNIPQSSRDTADVDVGVGTVRTLTLARPLMGRDKVEEVILAVEPGQLLAYRLRGGAAPLVSAGTPHQHRGNTRHDSSERCKPRGPEDLVS